MSLRAASPVNASNFVNFDPKNFPNLRAAYGKMLAGTLDPLIVCMGDSTMAGYNGSTYNGLKSSATPAFLGKRLTAKGIPASEEIGNVGGGNTSTFAWDSRFTLTTNWSLFGGSPISFMGDLMSSSTNAATLSFAPTRQIDSFDLVYYGGNTGSVTLNVDGGATLRTITNTNNAVMLLQNTACTLGTHTINVVQSGTTALFVAGIIPHTSTARQFNILNQGAGSGEANAYSTGGQPYYWGVQANWNLLGPGLLILELTINDANQPTPVATYLSQIQQIVTFAKTAGLDVIISTSNPISTTFPNWVASIGPYIAGLQNLALANGCGFIEMNTRRYVSYAYWNAIIPYFDTVHPAVPTMWDKAECYAQAIVAALGGGDLYG